MLRQTHTEPGRLLRQARAATTTAAGAPPATRPPPPLETGGRWTNAAPADGVRPGSKMRWPPAPRLSPAAAEASLKEADEAWGDGRHPRAASSEGAAADELRAAMAAVFGAEKSATTPLTRPSAPPRQRPPAGGTLSVTQPLVRGPRNRRAREFRGRSGCNCA